jgi:(p)ppGpp synthase/HD superfamily hydrolase
MSEFDIVDVDRAAEVARKHHLGQRDKGGRPYFDAHVADVYRRLEAEPTAMRAVALLHDVLEDTECTVAELEQQFPASVVAAVLAITHRPDEPRHDYYERVRANPVALTVKLADIASNTDPARMALLDEATRSRLSEKYRTALALLGGSGREGVQTRG